MSSPSPVTPTPADNEPILLIDHTAEVTTLTLNRPKQFNALSEAMLEALQNALDNLPESARVVILKARGRAFCAGHDLKEMRQRPEQAYYDALFSRCSRVMQTLLAIPQPVIAQVEGMATAAGCQLVANCDLAVAADDATFAVSGLNVGLFCSTPAVPLSRNIARKRAFEMLVTGEFIHAAQAVEWGLLNSAVPEAEVENQVQVLVDKIMGKSGRAIALGKGLFYDQLERPIAEAYALASQTMACNMMCTDAVEGIDAFIEKRAPTWVHK